MRAGKEEVQLEALGDEVLHLLTVKSFSRLEGPPAGHLLKQAFPELREFFVSSLLQAGQKIPKERFRVFVGEKGGDLSQKEAPWPKGFKMKFQGLEILQALGEDLGIFRREINGEGEEEALALDLSFFNPVLQAGKEEPLMGRVLIHEHHPAGVLQEDVGGVELAQDAALREEVLWRPRRKEGKGLIRHLLWRQRHCPSQRAGRERPSRRRRRGHSMALQRISGSLWRLEGGGGPGPDQALQDSLPHRRKHLSPILKAHLGFCRMDVHVEGVWRHLDEEKSEGMPSGGQKVSIGLGEGVQDDPVPDMAAVDEDVLTRPGGPGQGRGRTKALDPDSTGSFLKEREGKKLLRFCS